MQIDTTRSVGFSEIQPNRLSFKDCVKEFEGFLPTPYVCPGGHQTIGYGHRIREDESFTSITLEEAEVLLDRDLAEAALQMHREIRVPLTDGQKLALIDFVFNLGIGQARESTLFRLVNERRFAEAALQFERWVYASGKKLDGLAKRRVWERSLFTG